VFEHDVDVVRVSLYSATIQNTLHYRKAEVLRVRGLRTGVDVDGSGGGGGGRIESCTQVNVASLKYDSIP
jgi:hypothetical protein